MLSALQGSQVGEISAVVVRYYGGILLGTGGLVRAYGNGVQQALKLLETERKVERQLFQVHCDYAQLKLDPNFYVNNIKLKFISKIFKCRLHCS